jgi:hypothetical protein
MIAGLVFYVFFRKNLQKDADRKINPSYGN